MPDNNPHSCDSSLGDCPICLKVLDEYGVLKTCRHKFHKTCIAEWAKYKVNCPSCRTDFREVDVIDVDGNLVNTQVFDHPQLDKIDDDSLFVGRDADDDYNCVFCQQGIHPDMILLCDECDRGFHTYCLNPPLTSVPSGDWFCPECSMRNHRELGHNTEPTPWQVRRTVTDDFVSDIIMGMRRDLNGVDEDLDNDSEENESQEDEEMLEDDAVDGGRSNQFSEIDRVVLDDVEDGSINPNLPSVKRRKKVRKGLPKRRRAQIKKKKGTPTARRKFISRFRSNSALKLKSKQKQENCGAGSENGRKKHVRLPMPTKLSINGAGIHFLDFDDEPQPSTSKEPLISGHLPSDDLLSEIFCSQEKIFASDGRRKRRNSDAIVLEKAKVCLDKPDVRDSVESPSVALGLDNRNPELNVKISNTTTNAVPHNIEPPSLLHVDVQQCNHDVIVSESSMLAERKRSVQNSENGLEGLAKHRKSLIGRKGKDFQASNENNNKKMTNNHVITEIKHAMSYVVRKWSLPIQKDTYKEIVKSTFKTIENRKDAIAKDLIVKMVTNECKGIFPELRLSKDQHVREIEKIVKKELKDPYQSGTISKDTYKTVMKAMVRKYRSVKKLDAQTIAADITKHL